MSFWLELQEKHHQKWGHPHAINWSFWVSKSPKNRFSMQSTKSAPEVDHWLTFCSWSLVKIISEHQLHVPEKRNTASASILDLVLTVETIITSSYVSRFLMRKIMCRDPALRACLTQCQPGRHYMWLLVEKTTIELPPYNQQCSSLAKHLLVILRVHLSN